MSNKSGPAKSGGSQMKKVIKPSVKKSGQNRFQKLQKKSHVRFDDYMDLNEENMRRSCKLLMTRLYSEPDTTSKDGQPAVISSVVKTSRSSSRPTSPPPSMQDPVSDDVDGECQKIGLEKNHLTQRQLSATQPLSSQNESGHLPIMPKSTNSEKQPSVSHNTSPCSSLGEQTDSVKSYLRSQYERRQRKQLDLMATKGHQRHDGAPKTQNATASNKLRSVMIGDDCESGEVSDCCRGMHNQEGHYKSVKDTLDRAGVSKVSWISGQQQDLVAKSHELSKRRFFEELQRREAKKNFISRNMQTFRKNPALSQDSMQIQTDRPNSALAIEQTVKTSNTNERRENSLAPLEEKMVEKCFIAIKSLNQEQDDQVKRFSPKRSDRQSKTSPPGLNNDDELMLNAYKTITRTTPKKCRDQPHSMRKNQLSRLDSPPSALRQLEQETVETTPNFQQTSHFEPIALSDEGLYLPNKLIGFHMQSPQLESGNTDAHCAGIGYESKAIKRDEQAVESLIEFSKSPSLSALRSYSNGCAELGQHHGQGLAQLETDYGGYSFCEDLDQADQAHRRAMETGECSGTSSFKTLEEMDKSKFEIRVPATMLAPSTIGANNDGSRNHQEVGDEFGCLLVVKQVEEERFDRGEQGLFEMLESTCATLADMRTKATGIASEERPHTLSGCKTSNNNEEKPPAELVVATEVRKSKSNKTLPHANTDYCTGTSTSTVCASHHEGPISVAIAIGPDKESAASSLSQPRTMTSLHEPQPYAGNPKPNDGPASGQNPISDGLPQRTAEQCCEVATSTEVERKSILLGTTMPASVASESSCNSRFADSTSATDLDQQIIDSSDSGSHPGSVRPHELVAACSLDGDKESSGSSLANLHPSGDLIDEVGQDHKGESGNQILPLDASKQSNLSDSAESAPNAALKQQAQTSSRSCGVSAARLAKEVADEDEVAVGANEEKRFEKTIITTKLAIRDVLPEANLAAKERQMAERKPTNVSNCSSNDAAAPDCAPMAPPPLYDVELVGQFEVPRTAATSVNIDNAMLDHEQQMHTLNGPAREEDRIEKYAHSSNKAQASSPTDGLQQKLLPEKLGPGKSFEDAIYSQTKDERMPLQSSLLPGRELARENGGDDLQHPNANPFEGSAANVIGASVNHDDILCAASEKEHSNRLKSASSSSEMASACESDSTRATRSRHTACQLSGLRFVETCSNEAENLENKYLKLRPNDRERPHQRGPAITHNKGSKTNISATGAPNLEEDIGSSCSSSGFGASVSVSSASSSTSSDAHSRFSAGKISTREIHEHQLAKNLAPNSSPRSGENHLEIYRDYETIRGARAGSAQKLLEDEFPDYKQLVGPDQAYPRKKGHPLVIDNHSYALLLNRCQMATKAKSIDDYDQANEEQNLSSVDPAAYCYGLPTSVQCAGQQIYANLPLCAQPQFLAEYATVRTSTTMRARSRLSMSKSPVENKGHSSNRPNSVGSESTLSEQSFSGASSAGSGGFSKLPPACISDRPPANNAQPFEETNAFNGINHEEHQRRERKISILKRFGSLVSRAFTHNIGSSPGVVRGQQQVGNTSASLKPDSDKAYSSLRELAPDGDVSSKPNSQPQTLASTDERQIDRSQLETKTACKDESSSTVDFGKQCAKETSPSNSVAQLKQSPTETMHDDQKLKVIHSKKNEPSKLPVDAVDLVILPPKHQSTRRCKHVAANSGKINFTANDKASRTKKIPVNEARKKADVCPIDDSLHPSSKSLSFIGNDLVDCGRRRHASPVLETSVLKSSSLSDNLESLASTSEVDDSVKGKRAGLKDENEAPADIYAAPHANDAHAVATKQTIDGKSKHHQHHSCRERKSKVAGRIDIDCVSPVLISAAKHAYQHGCEDSINDVQSVTRSTNGKSRSLLNWFGVNSNSVSAEVPLQRQNLERAEATSVRFGCKSLNCDGALKNELRLDSCDANEKTRDHSSQNQPMSGFWSLIGQSHELYANKSEKKLSIPTPAPYQSKEKCAAIRTKHDLSAKKCQDTKHATTIEDESLVMHCRERNPSRGKKDLYRISQHDSDLDLEEDSTDCSSDDCDVKGGDNEHVNDRELESASKSFQSLNLYQNLVRNYVKQRRSLNYNGEKHGKRCHHHRSGHTHHHHHKACRNHHHSGHTCRLSRRSTNGRAQNYLSSTSQPCLNCLNAQNGKLSTKSESLKHANVWGQLIKIDKSDGSQVIELQRVCGKPWGFFVARGAIDNVKGESHIQHLDNRKKDFRLFQSCNQWTSRQYVD